VLAAVAAYFSIVGLAAIFSGAFLSVIVMASVLEFAKLVSAAWLHYEWERVNFLIRTYFIAAIAVLMFITSMGIFGYLSKAHIETSVNEGGNNTLAIEMLERRITNQEKIIKDSETVLEQLDLSVQKLIDFDRIRGAQGAIAVRESQKEERDRLTTNINQALEEIEKLQAELMPLKKQQLQLEVEVGPLKYVAELIYGAEAENHYDSAVRWVIIILVFVFDPLAVMLLIISTAAFKRDLKKPKIPLVDESQIMIMK
jgi:signal transduction histidine kinase